MPVSTTPCPAPNSTAGDEVDDTAARGSDETAGDAVDRTAGGRTDAPGPEVPGPDAPGPEVSGPGAAGAGAPTVGSLGARLGEVSIADAARLGKRLERLRSQRGDRRTEGLARLSHEVEAAARRLDRRRAAVPDVRYPPELPVSARREDLLAAIGSSQVVIVAGETGSGKTTQLPKICLELGRGVRGAIAHTQPRRLAARAIADRVADELGVRVGTVVGSRVRFSDNTGPQTLVKLMTDGILLAEIARDPLLLGYDTVIVDEAHERSLNIDFLLGYLTQLLPRRPDLKLVVTSATIDTARFSEHFGGAPVVEVSGRTYPVEVRYRPLVLEAEDDEDDDDEGSDASDGGQGGPAARTALASGAPGRTRPGAPATRAAARDVERDQTQAVCDAVAELSAAGPGDILVFLSGEREIRDTADALERLDLRRTEVLQLYARLPAAEQHRVFSAHTGRRIVLATNVAETSLTVPGIRYVVDPGTARISRYSTRLRVQRLPIEPVSQASADQRAGRCGRVADGICIRLYGEADYLARPAFTDPEILRTNLASVILAMTALGLGDVAAFPFVERPEARAIRDGVDLLHELGALAPDGPDGRRRLSETGRVLSELPVDPRFGRMIVEAKRLGCVREAAVLAAALSIQDPRERPSEHREAAAAAHARFADPDSDFASYLLLWRYLREQRSELSANRFRRMCREQYLHHLRIREWQDLYSQLRDVLSRLDIGLADAPADPAAVTQAVLAGLLSHVGMWDGEKREYLGARGARFVLPPGTRLAKRPPGWVVVAELVETNRLRGRVAARIDPAWVEPLAGHLVKRSYSEPHWSGKRGSVVAAEKVTLYGLPVVAARTVQYGRVDPGLSRELFVRYALVEGDWRSPHRFLAANRELLARAEALEERTRRRDLVVDDETLFAFYDARLGPDVVSGRHFDTWWKRERRSRPELLDLTMADLLAPAAAQVRDADYPTSWTSGEVTVGLDYRFEPGAADDGVTVDVPLAVLNQLDADRFAWQVPGLRGELVTELIRSLPKALRRELVPAPDVARRVLPLLAQPAGPLLPALSAALLRTTGVRVDPRAFDPDRLPAHLRPRFRVTGPDGGVLGEGGDLEALRRRLAPAAQQAVSRATASVERSGLTDWSFGELPEQVRTGRGGGSASADRSAGGGGAGVLGYPALVDRGTSVDLRVLASHTRAAAETRAGLRRLLMLAVPNPVRALTDGLDNAARLTLAANPDGSVRALLEDCAGAAVDALLAGAPPAGAPPAGALPADVGTGAVRDRAAFDRALAVVGAGLADRTAVVLADVERVLSVHRTLARELRGSTSLALVPSLNDVRAQVDALLAPGFVTRTGAARLGDLTRWLRAALRRVQALPADVAGDRRGMARVTGMAAELDRRVAALAPGEPAPAALDEVARMVQELRVNVFAQSVGTPQPVSETRIARALAAYDAAA